MYTDSCFYPQETVGAYPSLAFVSTQTPSFLSSSLLPVACRKNLTSVNGNWDTDSVDCLICPDCPCRPLHGYGRFAVPMAIPSTAIHRSRVSFSHNDTNHICITYQTHRAVCGVVQYFFAFASYQMLLSYVLQNITFTLSINANCFVFFLVSCRFCHNDLISVHGNWDIDSVDCLSDPDRLCHPIH